MRFATTSFYKYVNIENPDDLACKTRNFCRERKIFGRILIAKEGINAAVSGETDSVRDLKDFILSNKFFSDVLFKDQDCDENVYHKLVVRVRPEIVAFGYPVNMKNKAEHVSPGKLKEWLDNNEDILLLDARNKYEFKIGKFKGAQVLPIETFKDFPKQSARLKDKKEKKIVMYCTGGVRCEKSSAFLKEDGFKNVYQLEGGIINFVNKFPDTYFEGACFVFDDRIVSHVNSGKPISKCEHCGEECDDYVNCHNLDCDKLVISCEKCRVVYNKTCSQECMTAPRQRKGVSG